MFGLNIVFALIPDDMITVKNSLNTGFKGKVFVFCIKLDSKFFDPGINNVTGRKVPG